VSTAGWKITFFSFYILYIINVSIGEIVPCWNIVHNNNNNNNTRPGKDILKSNGLWGSDNIYKITQENCGFERDSTQTLSTWKIQAKLRVESIPISINLQFSDIKIEFSSLTKLFLMASFRAIWLSDSPMAMVWYPKTRNLVREQILKCCVLHSYQNLSKQSVQKCQKYARRVMCILKAVFH
jgi:hypothetical protein